jgi:hypothetical protein
MFSRIGCEVEVRWRHYFPELWDKFLANRPYSDLSLDERDELTHLCCEQEAVLVPRLQTTQVCGVPSGKDRYYEFANSPCYHPYTLYFEIQLLKQLGLIPAGFRHSLQITIGGLGQNRDTGMLLMALEILGYSSPERILSAAVSDKAATWGRKGRAGLRHRASVDMLLGAAEGMELRTLELPIFDREIRALFKDAWLMANASQSKPARKGEQQYMKWLLIVDELEEIGRRNNIDTYTNWGRPWDNPEIWNDFATKLPLIDNTRLKELVDDL